MGQTKIEWTERTWNPVTGCTKVSPGCDNCYAETIANRFAGSKAFPNGFDVTLHPDRLAQPLKWRKPATVFVNSMSDLFHKDIPGKYIAKVFATMALTPEHTYQILTKRPGRMRSLLLGAKVNGFWDAMAAAAFSMGRRMVVGWPLPNVWLGVSVEDQKWANVRIPALLETPAAVRFLSCEPLLGPVWIQRFLHNSACAIGTVDACTCSELREDRIDWVIVGGESGPKARPMHPQWARGLRDQCQDAGVAYFFKQWGAWAPLKQLPHKTAVTHRTRSSVVAGKTVYRVGKGAAGRELDGRLWDEMPREQVPA